jgi:hypothetical protein
MTPLLHHSVSALPAFSRREWLQRTGAGFGYLAFSALATQRALAEVAPPVAPKQPHFPARAKRVLFLCMDGGPSHVDCFDYKPELAKYAGKPIGKGKVPTGKLMMDQRLLLRSSARRFLRCCIHQLIKLLGIRFSEPGLPACPEARVGGGSTDPCTTGAAIDA